MNVFAAEAVFHDVLALWKWVRMENVCLGCMPASSGNYEKKPCHKKDHNEQIS